MSIQNVYAGTCGNKTIVFQCETENHKEIIVCADSNRFIYSFGKVGKSAEKTIKQRKKSTNYKLWDGYGSSANQSITFNQGAYGYKVFSDYERRINGVATLLAKADETVPSGGVIVSKNGKTLTTVGCKADTMKDEIQNYLLDN